MQLYEEEEETKSNFLGCYDPNGLAGISHTTITQKHTRIVVAYRYQQSACLFASFGAGTYTH